MDVKRGVVLLAALALMTGVLPVAGSERPRETGPRPERVALPEGEAVLHLAVMDKRRFSLPGVVLCLKNERGVRIDVTDENGASVMKVPGDEYSLKVQIEGFVEQVVTGIRIIDERELELDVILLEREDDYITSTGEPLNEC